MATPRPELLDIDALIADRTVAIMVCCGSGGVGKTTTAAAIALRAAEAGREVVVLTIDPAKRLAQALGLTQLDNTPAPVEGISTSRSDADSSDTDSSGSLDAMMLDMKRTFDDVVHEHSTPERAEQILANPFYQAVSSSFAGTQEYMAMEKLGQLRAQRRTDGRPRWDLIVVDTPPSRSALDFLDAPKRLGSFLDGRFIRLLAGPAKVGGRAYLRVFSAGVNVVAHTLTRVLGAQVLTEVQTFVAALDTMFGGFRERADHTYALLQERGTAFLVVAVPERDALREASYFVDRLAQERMPLAGVVLNRIQRTRASGLSASRALAAAETLADDAQSGQDAGGADTGPHAAADLAEGLLRLHAELAETAARHQSLARGFIAANPQIPLAQVPIAAHDIHDLDGLRVIGDWLAAQ